VGHDRQIAATSDMADTDVKQAKLRKSENRKICESSWLVGFAVLPLHNTGQAG
jgi:hypothetical protein